MSDQKITKDEKAKQIIKWVAATFNNPDYAYNLKKFRAGYETDPCFTKEAGRYTAVDAMSQIMRMTALYGPIGEGWKYDVNYVYHDTYIAAEVCLQIYSQDNNEWTHFGPICSVMPLLDRSGKIDQECAKKAMTNALTKAFSHTGLNADVFMGLFDDNTYVAQQEKRSKSVGEQNKQQVKEIKSKGEVDGGHSK